MPRRKTGIPGLSFSWKRAVGISAAKAKFARETGIPTTRSGRQRKFGRAAGCMTVAVMVLAVMAVVFALISG
jgi:hypothetical protein